MRVLIVENNQDLGVVWKAHLERLGAQVTCLGCEDGAVKFISENQVDAIVLDLDLADGRALPVADYAAYRQPGAKVVFVTTQTFFSDGSAFAHAPNACACLPAHSSPSDLATLVAYHAERPTASTK